MIWNIELEWADVSLSYFISNELPPVALADALARACRDVPKLEAETEIVKPPSEIRISRAQEWGEA